MSNDSLKETIIIEKKIRRLSHESFKTKVKKTKIKYSNDVQKIKSKYSEIFEEKHSSQKERVLKSKRKMELRRVKNIYAINYNALINQELYRKSILETQIYEAKAQYYKRKQRNMTFDKVAEKEHLKDEILKIKGKYKKPISTHYRKNRNKNFDVELPYVKISVNTPIRKMVGSLLLMLLAALIAILSLDVFIKPWGIYNAGLRGITQAYFYLIQKSYPDVPNFVSYALFLGANIPLAIFGYLKVGKKFTIYTIIYIIFQLLISLGLQSSGIFKHIIPFGESARKIISHSAAIKYVIPFVAAIIGGILYGVSAGMVYRASGSTGGTKFVVTYYSAKKNKSVGFIAMFVAMFVIAHGIILNQIISAQKNVINAFTSNVLFASVIFVYLSNWALDKVFAKTKKMEIKLYTNKKNEIIKFLDLYFMYSRSFSVNEIQGGLHGKSRYCFEFVVSTREAKNMIEIFRNIDKSSFVYTTNVQKVYGKFYNMWFE